MSRARAILYWAILVSPGLIPFVCVYLPFQDWPGHVGQIGVVALLSDPASKAAELYPVGSNFGLNIPFNWPAILLHKILPSPWGSNLVLAAALAALAPATHRLCRAVDADPRLALFVVPLALGKHLYAGFAENTGALVFIPLSFATLYELRRQPDLRRGLYFAASATGLAAMHGVIYLAGGGLLFLAVVFGLLKGHRRATWWSLGGLLISAGFFLALALANGVKGQAGGPSPLDALIGSILADPREHLFTSGWEWLFAHYRHGTLDDQLQAAWLLLLALGFVIAIGIERWGFFRSPRFELLFVVLVTVAFFWILPEEIGPPILWWGARQRLPAIGAVLAVPTLGAYLWSRWPALLVLPGAIAVGVVVAISYDLHRFEVEEMEGFEEVLAAIPKGQRLAYAYADSPRIREYPGYALGYFGNYYVAEKGGEVTQGLFDRHEHTPLRARKRPLAGAPWGLLAAFRFEAHAVGFEGVLVLGYPGREPFSIAERKRLELVAQGGRWRYYRPAGGAPTIQ
jgi:hypothetical protein